MPHTRTVYVTEVHNFGGFFGGDSVTLSAMSWPEGEAMIFMIDEKALENVSDRYIIAPGMVLQLDLSGERVDRARLVGAREWASLRDAFGVAPPAEALAAPRMRAYHCITCNLWLEGQPAPHNRCRLCGQPLDGTKA